MKITSEMPVVQGPNAIIELTPTEVIRLRHVLFVTEGNRGKECLNIGDNGDSLYSVLYRAGFTSVNWNNV